MKKIEFTDRDGDVFALHLDVDPGLPAEQHEAHLRTNAGGERIAFLTDDDLRAIRKEIDEHFEDRVTEKSEGMLPTFAPGPLTFVPPHPHDRALDVVFALAEAHIATLKESTR